MSDQRPILLAEDIVKPVDFTQFSQAVRHLGLFWSATNEPSPGPR